MISFQVKVAGLVDHMDTRSNFRNPRPPQLSLHAVVPFQLTTPAQFQILWDPQTIPLSFLFTFKKGTLALNGRTYTQYSTSCTTSRSTEHHCSSNTSGTLLPHGRDLPSICHWWSNQKHSCLSWLPHDVEDPSSPTEAIILQRCLYFLERKNVGRSMSPTRPAAGWSIREWRVSWSRWCQWCQSSFSLGFRRGLVDDSKWVVFIFKSARARFYRYDACLGRWHINKFKIILIAKRV